MCRRIVRLVSFVLVLAAANGAAAETLYYDNFDGPTGADLNGTTPDITTDGATWVAGNDFDADGKVTNDGGSMGDSAYLPFIPQDHYIYELSAKIDARVSPLRNNSNDWIAIGFTQSNADPDSRFYDDNGSKNPVYWAMTRTDQTTSFDQTFTGVNTAGGQPTTTKSADHIRIVLDAAAPTWVVSWYYDGVLQRRVNVSEALKPNFQYVALSHARPDGFIDDFTLTQELAVQATRPDPADDSLASSTNVILQWQPGVYAVRHDVYIGTNLADVNSATTSTSVIYKGRQDPNNYSAAGLTPGATYYWRIDEVNGVNVWRGSIWSFRVLPPTAYNPNPPDGAKYMDINVDLAWSPGAKAQSHKVYFGTTDPLPLVATQAAATYALPSLAYGTTYYWRIDEVNGANTWPGDLWRFETRPDIKITDPNLVGWWKFDEGQGTIALDWSGHGNHGTLVNGTLWVTGYDNGGLQFDGLDDHVDLATLGSVVSALTGSSFAIWVNFPNVGPWDQHIFDFGTGTDVYMYLSPRTNGTGPLTFQITTGGGGAATQVAAPSTLASGWHHVAVAIDGVNQTMNLYVDGALVASAGTQILPRDLGNTTQNWLGRSQAGGNTWFVGLLDDFRIYNRSLTQGQVERVMTGDPLKAWNPRPANRSQPDIEHSLTTMWNSGDDANEHDVYFGDDPNVVANANTTTAGVYRGRQSSTMYSPPETLKVGQTRYWRIDEINTDATITKGSVWSFTIADYLVVDDFEDYDVNCTRLYYTWRDGLSFEANPTCGFAAYAGNGTGSTVGNNQAPYVERTIVHLGVGSMPVRYFNVNPPYYSEARREWPFGQDWTRKGVKSLTLWFRGLAENAPAPLYIIIQDSLNNGKTFTYPDPNAALATTWQRWDVDMKDISSAGVNLASIKKMTIGMDNRANVQAAGIGTMYFDDILLYPPRCRADVVKPVCDLNNDCIVDYRDLDLLANDWMLADQVIATAPPGTTALAALYAMENNVQDSSGNSRNGTASGDPAYVAGATASLGTALRFDGTDDSVDLPIGPVIAASSSMTATTWVNFSGQGGAWQRIFDFGIDTNIYMFLTPRQGTTGAMRLAITTSSGAGENRADSQRTLPTGWHHAAAVIDGAARTMRVYLDGLVVATGTTTVLPSDLGTTTQNWLGRSQYTADAFLNGSLDDFRIYSRALSAAEVAYLADTTPADGKLHVAVQSPADFYSVEPDGSQKINFRDYAVLAASWLQEKLWPQP